MKNQLSPEEISRNLYRYDRIADKLDGVASIGEEQIRTYHNEGYLAVEQVLSKAETANAINALMDILLVDPKGAAVQFSKPSKDLNTNEERELAVRKIAEFVECDEHLKAIAYHPDIIATLEKILGEPPILCQDMALMKPPLGGGEKPWHQDMAYGPLAYNKPVIGVWIALDDAELDNGCMHVIPGSHAEGATPHYAVRDWQICDTHIPVERDVAIPLKSGGLMFFHGLIKHGTPYNLSPKRRRALQFHYVGASAEKLTGKEYKRIFTNEMTNAEC